MKKIFFYLIIEKSNLTIMAQILFPRGQQFRELLRKKIPIRFSCITNSGWPIVISLWFIEKNGKIYCATQNNAKIITHLRSNPRCAFEIAADKPPYLGLRGKGAVSLRKDIAVEILEYLISKYLKNKNSPLGKFLVKNSKNEIAIEITPSSLFAWDYSKRMQETE